MDRRPNTTTVDRELTRTRRLIRHKCKYGSGCCPACLRLFVRLGQVVIEKDAGGGGTGSRSVKRSHQSVAEPPLSFQSVKGQ
jgi:hypothetical protein